MHTHIGLFVAGMTLASVGCGNDPLQRIEPGVPQSDTVDGVADQADPFDDPVDDPVVDDPEGAAGEDTVSSCGVVDSILAMPPGATVVDLNVDLNVDCEGCGCCSAEASVDCEQCGFQAALAANGISSPDAFGTGWVDCVSGNADAPTGGGGLFLMPSRTRANGTELTLVLDHGVTAFGLVVAPSSSDPGVPVTLKAYAADGTAIGTTTLDLTGLTGESCDSVNAVARFVGLQSCGTPITRVVVRAGHNMMVDTLTFL